MARDFPHECSHRATELITLRVSVLGPANERIGFQIMVERQCKACKDLLHLGTMEEAEQVERILFSSLRDFEELPREGETVPISDEAIRAWLEESPHA